MLLNHPYLRVRKNPHESNRERPHVDGSQLGLGKQDDFLGRIGRCGPRRLGHTEPPEHCPDIFASEPAHALFVYHGGTSGIVQCTSS